MKKEIDINNEEQILKECDFDYLYSSEKCSRELCCFYNDIIHSANKMQSEYDVNRAFIGLGRIAITLNKQSARIKELEEENKQLKQQLSYEEITHDLCIESFNDECEELSKQIKFESEARERLKQSQNSKAIEVLEKVKNELFGVSNPYWRHYFKTGIAFASCDDIELFVEEYIDNLIKELEGEK